MHALLGMYSAWLTWPIPTPCQTCSYTELIVLVFTEHQREIEKEPTVERGDTGGREETTARPVEDGSDRFRADGRADSAVDPVMPNSGPAHEDVRTGKRLLTRRHDGVRTSILRNAMKQ